MIKKQYINLTELKREAENSGAAVTESLSRSRCYITDYRELMLASTGGIVRIPIEQVTQFYKELTRAIKNTGEEMAQLTLEEKNILAKERKMTYGQLQIIIADLKELGERKEIEYE